jgi:hypothetical protein
MSTNTKNRNSEADAKAPGAVVAPQTFWEVWFWFWLTPIIVGLWIKVTRALKYLTVLFLVAVFVCNEPHFRCLPPLIPLFLRYSEFHRRAIFAIRAILPLAIRAILPLAIRTILPLAIHTIHPPAILQQVQNCNQTRPTQSGRRQS